jgi:hypothetical protein
MVGMSPPSSIEQGEDLIGRDHIGRASELHHGSGRIPLAAEPLESICDLSCFQGPGLDGLDQPADLALDIAQPALGAGLSWHLSR